jgi:hypothetical protein
MKEFSNKVRYVQSPHSSSFLMWPGFINGANKKLVTYGSRCKDHHHQTHLKCLSFGYKRQKRRKISRKETNTETGCLNGVVFVMATFAMSRDLGLEWTELAFTRVASLLAGRSMQGLFGGTVESLDILEELSSKGTFVDAKDGDEALFKVIVSVF